MLCVEYSYPQNEVDQYRTFHGTVVLSTTGLTYRLF